MIILTTGHPGYPDNYILDESSCNVHRVREPDAIISPKLRQWIIDEKIMLMNQRDVINRTSEYQDHLREIDSPLWVGGYRRDEKTVRICLCE